VAEVLHSVQCAALWFNVVVFSGNYCLLMLNKMDHFGSLWWVFEAPRIDCVPNIHGILQYICGSEFENH